MSGRGTSADRATSLSVGYREHLVKPFDPQALDRIFERAATTAASGETPATSVRATSAGESAS